MYVVKDVNTIPKYPPKETAFAAYIGLKESWHTFLSCSNEKTRVGIASGPEEQFESAAVGPISFADIQSQKIRPFN